MDNIMNNSQFNVLSKYSDMTVLSELQDAIDEVVELRKKLSQMSKEEIRLNLDLQDRLNYLCGSLKNGIKIEIPDFKLSVSDKIETYLKPFGYSHDFISQNFDETTLYVSDINLLYNGKFVCFGTKIGMDYRYAEFDTDGKFIGIDPEHQDLALHALTHEFFHKCSACKKESEKKTLLFSDALSEGFTEMFTINALSSDKNCSKNYAFFVKLCNLFTEMMGIDNALSDYINDIEKFPQLRKLFSNCGLNDDVFDIFHTNCNKLLCLLQSGTDNTEIEQLKETITDFTKDYVVIPYCNINGDYKVIQSFNREFSENKIDDGVVQSSTDDKKI